MKHMTFPRLLVVAVALNLLLSVTASPFYLGTNLQPPDPQPGDECEVTYICVCPLVFCELLEVCYEVGHNCGTGPKK